MKPIKIIVSDEQEQKLRELLSEIPVEESVHVEVSAAHHLHETTQQVLHVTKEGVMMLPDWYNQSLPFLFPRLPFDAPNLFGLLLHTLGLEEDALAASKEGPLCEILNGLYGQQSDSQWLLKHFEGHKRFHNLAVLALYQQMGSLDSIEGNFQQARSLSSSGDEQAFTVLHYAVYLQDRGALDQALELIDDCTARGDLSLLARNTLLLEQHRIRLVRNEQRGSKTSDSFKESLWQLYEFFKNVGADFHEAELLAEMSKVALKEASYSEALGYVNKAISIYREHELIELLIQLYVDKATILHQWAKATAPQFYMQAIESYQEALKLFKREQAPFWFAEIHHRLGVLYAEMPEQNQKRAIWAAVSASSFKEALSYYKKEDMPYEYATVCHNYATALISYPEAIRSDNTEKALSFFNEALVIRTAVEMPFERCMSLLNYVEACWEANNVNETMERARLADMQEKLNEVIHLSSDDDILARAEQHLASIRNFVQNATP